MSAPNRFNHVKIEKKWQRIWRKGEVYEPDFLAAKKPFYNLMMFPYPSAEGLHVGNMYAFVGSDIYGRFKRMQGYNVLEPIGLDGFGIHSENYALKIGEHPMTRAKVSEKRFYEQLAMIGNGFAWKERLETYDPEYYRWTQWIFTQLFKNGLAYRKKQPVNWCSSCKTVLADEQVISGKCERCSTVVVKKEFEQWFFRITQYAEKLLKNLEKIDWSEKVKIAQRNWIGKSEGALIRFKIKDLGFKVDVFTTRPDTLFGATYMVVAPEHKLLKNNESRIKNYEEVQKYITKASKKSEEERIAGGKEKTGVELKGIKAINPANKKEMPIFVADYVLSGYGTGAIMAVPAHDERDWEFAKKFNLPITMVICPNYPEKTCPVLKEAYTGEGHLVGSGKFDGMETEKAKWEITKFVGGKKKIQYRLRDWLISRQRYWGPPIPMIYCEYCAARRKGERKEMHGWYAVLEKDLPVQLPFIKNFRPQGKGESPLASVAAFYKTTCPACKKTARRETDVSDTFLDSSWYFLRYPSVAETRKPWNPARTKKWLPVTMYIGGAEHSVLHLLYSRFLTMVFHDLKLVDFEEPFTRFRAHGLLIKEGSKMSKSKGNVVNPDDYISKFGADTLRMYLMFLAPFEQGGDFRDAGLLGIERFLQRLWRMVTIRRSMFPASRSEVTHRVPDELRRVVHKTIKKVTEDIDSLNYNTAISQLMMCLNEGEKYAAAIDLPRWYLETMLLLVAPFAPHLAEELWQRMGHTTSIHNAEWPSYDQNLIKEKAFALVIQVNGKVRHALFVPAGIAEAKAREMALGEEKVTRAIGGAAIRKVIFVPDRLINFVVS